jgi:hypothetical protein
MFALGPVALGFLKGSAAVGGVGLGGLGVSSFLDRRNRRNREAAVSDRLGELTAGYQPPRINPSDLPSLAIPDSGAYRQRITDATDARRSGIQQMRGDLEGMYNFAEDPMARALLEFSQENIGNRASAFQQGTRSAFDDATQFIGARRDSIDPAARAAEMSGIYGTQAAAAQRAVDTTAADISTAGGRDVVGVGAADGDAADIADMLGATGGFAGDAARAAAQLSQDSLDYLAAMTQTTSAARQGELFNAAQASQAEAERLFMLSEMDRVNRERSEFRAAEMALRNQELGLDADLLERLAEADMMDAQARNQAENFWVERGGLAPTLIDQAAGDAVRAQMPQEVERVLLLAAVEGREEFERAATAMLADPDRARILATQYGITSADQAGKYWKENYGGSGTSEVVQRIIRQPGRLANPVTAIQDQVAIGREALDRFLAGR